MKITNLLLAAVLIINMFCFPVMADEAEAVETVEVDQTLVAEIIESEAYGLLSHLTDIETIISASQMEPVSRSAFVRAAVQVFDIQKTESVTLNFIDLPAEDVELQAALELAVGAGMISNGNTFRPEEPILIAEAIKICAVAAGFEEKAMALGGYPNGYYDVAIDQGMVRGISGDMTVQKVYALFLNTLNAEVIVRTGIRRDGVVEFSTKEGVTVLEEIYDIVDSEGLMNASELGALGNEEFIYNPGTVRIDDVKYKVEEDWNHYLGYNLSVYYTEDEETGDCTIVYLHPKDTEVFKLRDRNAMYTGDAITYYEGKREKELDIAASFDYIYNGKPFYGYTDEDIIPQDGEMLLIDNNDDGTYDVISVIDYYYMKATVVNQLEEMVFDDRGSEYTINGFADDVYIRVFKADGSEIALGQIPMGSILAVRASKDKSIYYVQILENSVSGTLTEMSAEDNTLVIDAASFEVSEDFASTEMDKLGVGGEYSFMLGMYGELVMLTSKTTALDYGFLTRTRIDPGISGKIHAEIYTKTGKFITAPFADKLMVDGDSGVKAADALTRVLAIGESQLLKYALNADGEINKLDLETVTNDIFAGEDDPADDSLRRFEFAGNPDFRLNCFYPYYYVNGATVFVIPNDVTDQDAFGIGYTFDYQKKSEYTRSTVFPYNIASDTTAEVIVFRTSGAKSLDYSQSTPVILVEKITTAINEDGDSLPKIYGWSNGQFIEYFVEEDVALTGIMPGDIVAAGLNGNTITDLEKNFDAETLTPDASVSGFVNKPMLNFQYQMGLLYTYEGGFAYLAKKDAVTGEYDFSGDDLIAVQVPSKVALYDTKSKMIRPADPNYVKTYRSAGNDASFLVVQQHYLNGQYAVIYTAGE